MTRGARYKHHVVEFTEGQGASNRLVPSRNTSSQGGGAVIGVDADDEVAEV